MKTEKLNQWIENHLKLIFSLVAQVLSLLLFICTFSSDQLVEKEKINIPTLQTLPTYLSLFLIFSIWSFVKPETLKLSSIKSNWWKYFLYALFDVEANFLMIKAFQYTSPASIQLLDASVIPIVMVLSIIFLKTKYKCMQYFGAVITVIGAVSLVIIDVRDDFSALHQGKNPLIGDLLVVGACVCYAISNVLTESLVDSNGIGEIIFFQALFASIIVSIQGGILEHKTLMSIEWTTRSIMLLCAFSFALIMFYLLVPMVIKHISASGMNISLVTTDIYTIIYYSVTYKTFSFLYGIGALIVTAGCIIFNAQTLYIEYINGRTNPQENNVDPPVNNSPTVSSNI